MIYDRFENLDLYCQPGTCLHQRWCMPRCRPHRCRRRTDIDGDRLYASVATTRPDRVRSVASKRTGSNRRAGAAGGRGKHRCVAGQGPSHLEATTRSEM